MSRLTIDIEKQLGSFGLTVSLAVDTEILVLFGPSGAGKTTTLNAIAGLVTPDAGEIVLDGQPFFRQRRPGAAVNRPSRQRGVGYVFQHYALFPHLTAEQNVAYALWRQRDSRPRALTWLDHMGIAHLANRLPVEMSGGQQQRVALARALAAEPRVLLLDEPFSALDAAVRERLQRDLVALQQDLDLIVICVTHRLEDALAVGHRLAVFQDGQVEQIGPIDDVVGRPVSHTVATMVGIRNLFEARVAANQPDGLVLEWKGLRLEASPRPLAVGTRVTAYIRPEDIKILYPDRPVMRAVSHNQVQGVIVHGRQRAHDRVLRVALAPAGQEVEVVYPAYAYAGLSLATGETVRLSLRKEALTVIQGAHTARLPADTEVLPKM